MITNFYEFINEHLNSIESSEQGVHARTMNEPHLSAISGAHLPRRAARLEKEIGFVIWGLVYLLSATNLTI